MRFERIQLKNFQSYQSADLSFGDGLTMIQGSNGAGKSSLLRAIFGGLFQTNATNETSSDYSLADLVTRGEDEGSVTLTFSVGGVSYTIEWVIRVTDDDGERKGSTKSCTLTSPAFADPIEGVRDVRQAVRGLIGMGATEFANSVYVQQKRFSRLVEANERERKEILDGLLGLNDLDTYSERMKRARRPAKRKRDEYQSRLQEVQDRIDQYDKTELRKRRSELENAIEDKKEDLDDVSEKRDLAQRRADQLKNKISDYEDTLERREAILEEIDEKKESLSDVKSNIRTNEERIEAIEQDINDLQEDIPEEIDGYDVSTKESTQDALTALQERRDEAFTAKQEAKQELEQAKEKRDRLEEELTEAREQLEEAESALDEARNMVLNLLSSFDVDPAPEDIPDGVRTAVRSWVQEVDMVDEPEKISEDALDDRVTSVDEKRESLGNELSQIETELTQLERDKESTEDELETAREEYEKTVEVLGDEETDPMEAYQEAMESASDIAGGLNLELNGRDAVSLIKTDIAQAHDAALNKYHSLATERASVDELEDQRETLEKLNELTQVLAEAVQYEQLASVSEQIEELENELERLNERGEELTNRKSNKETRREKLEQHVDRGETLVTVFGQLETLDERETEVDEAREIVEETQEEVEVASEEVDEAREKFESASDSLEVVEETQEEVEDIIDTYDEIGNERDKMESLQTEIEQLETRAEDLRSDIASRREELSDVEEDIDGNDIDDLREQKEKAVDLAELAEENRDSIQDDLDELKNELTRVTQDLEALDQEKERAENLQEKAQEYDDLVTELTEMIEVYDDVKVELREQTLGLLNEYTNQVFDDLYESESYIGVRIDQDYRIRLVTGDGQEIDPDKCSGGEGVITNIALRAGVYRVISEQDESGGDALPPFILDEPTNHLDSEHVSQIEEAIQSIQDWNVPQVFVVSHRESLLTSADHTLHVEKDPATNRSVAEFRDS